MIKMRNSFGTYLCDWCTQPLKHDCLPTAKYCDNRCRNKFRRNVIVKGESLKKQIRDTKLKLYRLESELSDYKKNKLISRRRCMLAERVYYNKNRKQILKRAANRYYERKLLQVRRDYEEIERLPLDLSKLWSSSRL
jgi:hypothetical protein